MYSKHWIMLGIIIPMLLEMFLFQITLFPVYLFFSALWESTRELISFCRKQPALYSGCK